MAINLANFIKSNFEFLDSPAAYRGHKITKSDFKKHFENSFFNDTYSRISMWFEDAKNFFYCYLHYLHLPILTLFQSDDEHNHQKNHFDFFEKTLVIRRCTPEKSFLKIFFATFKFAPRFIQTIKAAAAFSALCFPNNFTFIFLMIFFFFYL